MLALACFMLLICGQMDVLLPILVGWGWEFGSLLIVAGFPKFGTFALYSNEYDRF